MHKPTHKVFLFSVMACFQFVLATAFNSLTLLNQWFLNLFEPLSKSRWWLCLITLNVLHRNKNATSILVSHTSAVLSLGSAFPPEEPHIIPGDNLHPVWEPLL